MSSDEPKEDADKTAESSPLATIGEVFSFVEDTKTKVYIALGFFFAAVAGLALPASLFLFADVLGDVSAVAEQGIDPGTSCFSYLSLVLMKNSMHTSGAMLRPL